VAGKSRSVRLVVPEVAGSQKVPLVIALHGNGDTAANFIQTSGLTGFANLRGFILAAPQGITQTIKVGSQTVPDVSWDAYRTTAEGNIDLPLLNAIRADLVASGSVDTQRIFPYGYSQGGYMSFRSAMESAAVLSCGAVIAAADPFGGSGGLIQNAARKIPISIQIGTKDWAIDMARSTKTALEQGGFPLDYHEIEGAGHVPLPGDAAVPLDYCLSQAL
jgi:polyhydroxybutyrate depolymerase